MGPLELCFIFADAVLLLASLGARGAWRRWMSVVAVAALIVAATQFDAVHWQMYPAYAVAAALGAWACVHLSRARRLPLFANLASILLLLASLGLGFLLPVFSLPKPDGPFAIGTITREWIRVASPDEVRSGSPAERNLTVQLWYPAAPGAKGPLAPYREGSDFSFHARYLSLVRTHAHIGAPLSPAYPEYPVILFSHMWNSGRSQNTFEFEMLASHGFIVAAIDHPRDSDDPNFNYNNDAEVELKNRQVDLRANDARFILDQLEKLNRAAPAALLTGRLDLARVGFMGHSFGGATAEETCFLDSRCKAGINMDGTRFGAVAPSGPPQPFFYMFSDNPLPGARRLRSPDPRVRYSAQIDQRDYARIRSSLARHGGYSLTIRGGSHLNFTDRPLFSPWRRLTGAGPVDPRLAMREIDAYTLAFFEKYLKGEPAPLLDGAVHPYPNIAFEAFPQPTLAAAPPRK